MEKGKWCYLILASQYDSRGFIPSVVEEDKPGHSPLVGRDKGAVPWYWGSTYQQALAVCQRANLKIGITPERAADIVLSSMRAGRLSAR